MREEKIMYWVLILSVLLLALALFIGIIATFASATADDAEAVDDPAVLTPGWNLTGGKNQTIEEFWDRYPTCVSVWSWEYFPERDGYKFEWHVSFQGEPLTENSVTYMHYDRGYWVYCEAP